MAATQLRVSRPVASHPPSINAQLALAKVSTVLKTHFDVRSTPGVLRALQVACLVLIGLGLWAEWSYCNRVRYVVKTIQIDSVPSIKAAEEMRKDLADAHADAVNALLDDKARYKAHWSDFRQSMDKAHDVLIDAAKNITYEGEREAILTLTNHLATYEQVLGEVRARWEMESTKGPSGNDAADKAFHADTIKRIDDASQVMSDGILAEASQLDLANYKPLSVTYDGFVGKSYGLLAPSVLCVGLLLSFLTMSQWYLFRTTHRVVNPGLALATIVSIVLGIYGLQNFYEEAASLRVAYKDAFDSVHALRKAQSVAYDANAQESIYLLNDDPAEKRKNYDAFARDSGEIWSANAPFEKNAPFLNAEKGNVTFSQQGEGEASQKCIDTWEDYVKVDGEIRSLEKEGNHKAAVELNLGRSNDAFHAFDNALDATIKINQDQFDLAMKAAAARLDLFPLWTGLAAVLMAGAVILGLKPRLDEYRF